MDQGRRFTTAENMELWIDGSAGTRSGRFSGLKEHRDVRQMGRSVRAPASPTSDATIHILVCATEDMLRILEVCTCVLLQAIFGRGQRQ